MEGAVPLPLPRLQGVAAPPAGLTQSQGDAFAMSPEERAKYEMLFPTYDTDSDGFITGAEAVNLFMR